MSEPAVKFREPPPFKITDQTKLEDWKNWLKTYRCYAGGANLTNKSHEEQISIFKSLVGPDAMKIYENFSLSDITDVESVIEKFHEHFTPKLNFTVERLKFNRMTQQPEQNFEEFLAAVSAQAEKCNFGPMLNDFLLDKIVVGISDEDIRNSLLGDEELNYDKAVRICRASAKRNFMSKIDIGEKTKDAKQDVSNKKGFQKQTPSKNVRKSAVPGPKKPALLDKTQISAPVKKRKAVQKSSKRARKVEVEVPELSVTTRRRSRSLKHDGEVEVQKPAETKWRDDSGSESADEYADDAKVGSSDGDWNGDDYGDSDDDIDEEDKTFEPEVKIRVRNIDELVERNGKRKKRSKRTALKITVPPGDKPFSCHHCGFKCAKKGYIRKHMNIHTAEKLYACDQCDYKSIRPQGLFRHKFRHTGEKPYACEICDFRCSHQSSLKKHIMGHTGEKPHACDLCDYRAIVADKLKMHRMKHHTGEKPFKCASCPFACTHKGNLKNHMLTHSETRPFACDVCDRRFNSNFHLKQHTLTHTGEKPFACHVCDFRSAQLGGLRTHLKRHTGEKPHVCHICGHRTSLKGNLKKHMLTHTGEKPYACNVCSYRSAQSSGLKTHMKVHTGEKPYVCDMCGYRCATNGNLKQHMKKHKNHPSAPEHKADPAPQWHEPCTAVNTAECADYQNQDNQRQPNMQTLYVASQGVQRLPVISECRSVQREWQNQNPNPDPGQNPDPSPNNNVNRSLDCKPAQNQGENPSLNHSQNLNIISSPPATHIQHPNRSRNCDIVAHNPTQNPNIHPDPNHGQTPNLNVNHGHDSNPAQTQNPNLNLGQIPSDHSQHPHLDASSGLSVNHVQHLNPSRTQNSDINPSQNLNIISGHNPDQNRSHNPVLDHNIHLNHSQLISLNQGMSVSLVHCQNPGQNSSSNLGQSHSLYQTPNPSHLVHSIDQRCCGPRKDCGMYVSPPGT